MTTSSEPLLQMQRRHLRCGWVGLLLFVVLGGVLEALHAFKVDWYLAAGNETVRLMWRLAHAHGTLLSLVQVAFAVTVTRMERAPVLGSRCLVGAMVALPGGFLLGAFGAEGGDPGLGIALVPLGLVLLLVAIATTLRSLPR